MIVKTVEDGSIAQVWMGLVNLVNVGRVLALEASPQGTIDITSDTIAQCMSTLP